MINKNIMFLWIPKTAGMSIYHTLEEEIGMKLYQSDEFNNEGHSTFGHASLPNLLNEDIIDKDYWENTFLFTFARNPFSRAVSLWHYLKRHKIIDKRMTFINFLRKIKSGIDPIGSYNIKGMSQANKQVDWIDYLGIDFFGKFETVQEDFNKLCKLIGIQKIKLKEDNRVKLRNKPYQRYYNEHTIKLVREIYAEDFKQFNYSMNLWET